MTVKVNGIELFYETVGEGRPLVMVHGNGEDHTIFRAKRRILQGEGHGTYIVHKEKIGNIIRACFR